MAERGVALYADNLLLLLNDADSCLTGALQVLNAFSSITGLKVNWAESLLFPIDPGARSTAPQDVPLQWVENFRYLG